MATSPATKKVDWSPSEPRTRHRVTHLPRRLEGEVLEEKFFIRMLRLERKRTERSGKPFMLMLLDGEELFQEPTGTETLSAIVAAIAGSTRETDMLGWYEQGAKLAVLFSEIDTVDSTAVGKVIERVTLALRQNLGIEQFKGLKISFRVFPEHSSSDKQDDNFSMYPDLSDRHLPRKGERLLKRLIDVLGSLLALIALSPVMATIALLIKLTSKGPVLFRQQRLGLYGTAFTFLKFRSMYVNNDPRVHEEYVKSLIAGKGNLKQSDGSSDGVYKLTNDARITPLGKFLRKTSLDELPQFFNVLKGNMSLVGPRPPLPYEFDNYRTWHKSRVLEVKPGITGLWQVMGRSKTTFDEMVRLDLSYAKRWSIWLDLKILLQTPKAVCSGDGAY